MPKPSRIKEPNAVYHIVLEGLKESGLFKDDEDKDRYLSLVQKYQPIYNFKVYGFCLLSCHGHMIIDSNGADISQVMKSINQPYVQYFNRKHQRSGPLFYNGYKSLIINNTSSLVDLTKYIHNLPKILGEINDNPPNYKYSTLSAYIEDTGNHFEILDNVFVSSFFSSLYNQSKQQYLKEVRVADQATLTDANIIHTKSEYRSCKVLAVKSRTPEEILNYVIAILGVEKDKLSSKYNRKATQAKAITAFFMRNTFGYSYHDICKAIGNLSYDRVSQLSSKGYKIIFEERQYPEIAQEFFQK